MGSCAVGPCLVTPDEVPGLSELQISLRVARSGADVYSDTVNVAGLHRRPGDLVRWLFRALDFPVGVVLLTALRALRSGGRAVLLGIVTEPAPIAPMDLVRGEKSLIGSLSHVWDEDFLWRCGCWAGAQCRRCR